MLTNDKNQEEHKRFRTALSITQSCLIFTLILLVVLMMFQINRLQGTARVVNYAGLVRGATQRLTKLELNKNPNDELIAYLDEILIDLKYGDGIYNLVSLNDDSYQEKLDALMLYWESLKKQIQSLRQGSYEESDVVTLLDMSEVYFTLADETVSAAEFYSDKIARRIRRIELISALDMFLLLCLIMEQSFSAMQMRKKNLVLARKAYIDTQTGLQSKNVCEDLLNDNTVIVKPTACLMFDINSLKLTNDTYGHLAGDQLISDFGHTLKSVVREEDFAGRCGGDEFMVILYELDENTVRDTLARLSKEIERLNRLGRKIPISYAQGFAISTDYADCTLRTLFDASDRCMYANKQRLKAHRNAVFSTNEPVKKSL